MFGPFYALVRPLVQAIDAEKAHDLAIKALERLPLPSAGPDDPRLATTIAGLALSNPVGLAPGFDKNARVPAALFRQGFGLVEVGGVTPRPQPGNPQPRVFRLTEDEAVINRYGLNSDGMEGVAHRLEAFRARPRAGVLGINLGANKDSDDRTQDYVTLTRRLGGLADFLTLNISSPNTPGLRDLQGRAVLDDLVARVLDARDSTAPSTRIFVKIAPDIDSFQLDDIVDVASSRKVDGVIISNTTIARPDTLKSRALAGETGGLSGRPLFRASTILLAKAAQRFEGRMPLIGVGGISSGEDAVAKIAAGASAVQLYTGLIYKGPGLVGDIKTALLAAIEKAGVADVSGLVGRSTAAWAAAEP